MIGRDDIYDNVLNILEKCARCSSRMLRKHGIAILIIVQHNRDITNVGHQGFIYINHIYVTRVINIAINSAVNITCNARCNE